MIKSHHKIKQPPLRKWGLLFLPNLFFEPPIHVAFRCVSSARLARPNPGAFLPSVRESKCARGVAWSRNRKPKQIFCYAMPSNRESKLLWQMDVLVSPLLWRREGASPHILSLQCNRTMCHWVELLFPLLWWTFSFSVSPSVLVQFSYYKTNARENW